jgi:hypothetical protein
MAQNRPFVFINIQGYPFILHPSFSSFDWLQRVSGTALLSMT